MAETHYLDSNSIYLTLFWRPSPPGDLFHWGVYVKTADTAPNSGTLYHAVNDPAWRFTYKETYSFEGSLTGVLAVKIGTVNQIHTKPFFDALFAKVSVGHSVNEPPATVQNPWDCAVWTRDAVRMLHAHNIINCPDVAALDSEARRAAATQRDIAGRGGGSQRMVSRVSN